jgi:hypothetical protein
MTPCFRKTRPGNMIGTVGSVREELTVEVIFELKPEP